MKFEQASAQELIELRTALAITRFSESVRDVLAEAEKTIEHDAAKRVGFFQGLFFRLHAEGFSDWVGQNEGSVRPGTISVADKRSDLVNAVGNLCNHGEGLFDSNGFCPQMKAGKVAELLARFYKEVRSLKPFEYGTEIVLDVVISVLGKLPAFRHQHNSIDLRRLDESSKQALHEGTNLGALKRAFLQSMEESRTPKLKNKPNGFGKWENRAIEIEKVPFLSHMHEGELCLVTVNGGLVPYKHVQEEVAKNLRSDMQIAQFPPIAPSRIVGYLPGTEHLRPQTAGTHYIDNIPVTNGAAPLFCLGTNIISGLYTMRHDDLLRQIKSCAGPKATIFDLANNTDLVTQLLEFAETRKDRVLEDTIRIAFDRVSRITAKLDVKKEEYLKDRTRDIPNPYCAIVQGGGGSGKKAGEQIMEAICGSDYAIGSIDKSREESDLYSVLIAVGHHGDDYIFVEPFANALRTWVSDTAKERRINLLYDGSGIPFAPRYDDIAKGFKEANYSTHLILVDVPTEIAVERIKARAKSEGRALLYPVAMGKHHRAPISFMQALESSGIDKASFFANEGAFGQHYLVAETFHAGYADIERMRAEQQQGNLGAHLKELMLKSPDSTLNIMANPVQGTPASIEDVIARRMPPGGVKASYIARPGSTKGVLAIYDTPRMAQFHAKTCQNPNASGVEGLDVAPDHLPFLVQSGMLR